MYNRNYETYWSVVAVLAFVQGWQRQNKNLFLTPLNNNYTLSAYHTTTIGNQTKDYIVQNKKRTVTNSPEEDLELRAQQLTRSLMMSVGTDSKQNTNKITCFCKAATTSKCMHRSIFYEWWKTQRVGYPYGVFKHHFDWKNTNSESYNIYNGVMSCCLRLFCHLGAQLLSPLGSKIILRNTKTNLPWSKTGQI